MNLKLIKAGCVAGCAMALAAAPVAAADIYHGGGGLKDVPVVVPVQTFAGFYVGGHIGGAWGQMDGDNNREFGFPNGPNIPNVVTPVDPVFMPFRDGNMNGSSVFGGVQFGYNFQSGPWVYGLEVDIGGVGNMFSDHTVTVFDPTGLRHADFRFSGSGGWYGDVTGRLGYSWGPAMLYAKGGFAWFDPSLEVRGTFVDAAGNITSLTSNNDNNRTITGWTIGAGVEWLVNPSWSIKAEYLHFDFGNDSNNNCCFDGINTFRFFNRDLSVDTVKVGFNYFFHPEPAPLK